MLKTNIKVSSITNLTDARYFAAREVRWMGFCLDENAENYIPPHIFKAIVEWVDGPQIVGEFGLMPAAEIRNMAAKLDLQIVQLDFLAGVDVAQDLTGEFEIIKEIVVEPASDEATLAAWMEQFASFCDYFILDFEKNNFSKNDLESGAPVSMNFLKQIFQKYKCLLAIRESAENMEWLTDALRPHGLSLRGGGEEKTGFKSFDNLDEIFEKLELEDA